jgi:hypothetical protein
MSYTSTTSFVALTPAFNLSSASSTYSSPLPTIVGGGTQSNLPSSNAGVTYSFHNGVATSLTAKIIPALTFSGTSAGGGCEQARSPPPSFSRIARSIAYDSAVAMASKIPMKSSPVCLTASTTSWTTEGFLWSKTWTAPQRLLSSKLCAPVMAMT